MRRTMISLRGFQAPRASGSRPSGDSSVRKRPRSSQTDEAQNIHAPAPSNSFFLEAVQRQQQNSSLEEARTDESGTSSAAAAQEQPNEDDDVPLLDEQPLLPGADDTEDADVVAREIEEEFRMSEDLPFTPRSALGSYPHGTPLPDVDTDTAAPPGASGALVDGRCLPRVSGERLASVRARRRDACIVGDG